MEAQNGIDNVLDDVHKLSVDSSSSVYGVWQTTHLDSLIGDLQRGNVTSNCVDTKLEDSELEAVTVTDLVRRTPGKKKRRPKPRVVPTVRVYVGTFVHSTNTDPLQILNRWMIGVDGGKIIFSETVSDYKNMIEKYKLNKFEKDCVVKLEEGSFMMPGFVDCHTHVISYMLAGLKSKHRFLDQETSSNTGIKSCSRTRNLDDKSATNLFTSYVTLSMLNGTTCAAYNGSVVESAARLLVDTAVRFKQRAMVGLEMFHGDNRDDTHMFQLIKVRDVADHIIRKKSDRIHPCLILSKPLPDWLEKKFSDLAQEMELPIKLTVGDESHENQKESLKGWVELGESSSLTYHNKNGLINSKSILVNCSLCSNRDVKMIAEIGCSVVYCPSANLADCHFTTLPNLLRHHINVGLGSDLNTSHSVSMLETIRTAVQCSNLSTCWPSVASHLQTPATEKLPACNNSMMNDAKFDSSNVQKTDLNELGTEDTDNDDEDEIESEVFPASQVSYREFFRMATLGGAKGLEHKIGNFEVGKEFDALHIKPNLVRSKFVIVNKLDTMEDVIEKFIFLGDDRNVSQVYIAGERIV